MVNWRRFSLAVIALCSLSLLSASAAPSKTATVDMRRLVKAHPDARQADEVMQKLGKEFEAEQEAFRAELQLLKKAFNAAREEAMSKALSETAREKKMLVAEQKLTELRRADKAYREKSIARQKQVIDQRKRLRGAIVEKIQEVVKNYAKKNDIALVVDSSSRDSRGSHAVVYSVEGIDITDAILKLIDKAK